MKYLIIDDNETFAKQLFKQLNCNESNSENDTLKTPSENLNEFAESIYKIINKNEDIILCINVNLEAGKDSRQLQKGIELLIWLRIKGVMNHCVLYSFEDLHTILNREPKNLIATSKGTTFVQLPNNFQRIKEVLENLKTTNKLLASDDNIKTALKPAINIESIRHQEANWWGIKQLWDVHRLVKSKSKIDFPYPYGVRKAENDIESKICQFVYQTDESKLGSAIKSSTNLKIGSSIHLFKKGQQYEISINDNNFNDFSIEQSLKSSHYILNTRSPRILHIDDQWQDGWGEILCEIIYGKTANNIQRPDEEINSHNWNNEMISVKPTESDFTNLKIFLKSLDIKEFDLIILDLRLNPNKDKYKVKASEMTGALMLHEIRNITDGIPILMTTASNKIWSYEELKKLGADAYWMKEGVDNFNDTLETVKNYSKLLFLIEKLTGGFFQFVKEYHNDLQIINQDNSLWWKNQIEWKIGINNAIDLSNILSDNTTTPQQTTIESYSLDSAKKEDIIICLQQVLVKLRNYLRSYELDFDVQPDNKILSWHLRGIINDIGAICEIIHNDSKLNGSQIGGFINSKKTEIIRGDWIAQLLYILRNKASHYSESMDINIDNVLKIIRFALKWLNSPTVNNRPFSTDPNQNWEKIINNIEHCFAPPNTP